MGTFVPILMMLLSYLVGSIPVGYLIGKSKGIDIRSYGSHNIGATNASRTLGKGYGFIVFLLDFFKAGIFVIISKYLFNYQDDFFTIHIHPLIYGTLAILGHLFPIFLKFKGGKGIATTGGVIFAFHWQLGLVCAAVFLIITAISKYVSLGSICMVLIIPFILYFNNPHDWKLVIVGCIFTAMAIWRHRANIGRLMNGTENKLGQKVKR